MEDEGLSGLGVKASLARLYKSDQREFVEQLAGILERALPDETQIERRGGLFSEKKIVAIRLHLEDYIYSLELPSRGSPVSARTKVVRGIKLKTEPLSTEEWLTAISEALERFATSNQQTRDALWNLVESPDSLSDNLKEELH